METCVEASSLKLFINHDGIVWFVDGDGPPRSSKQRPREFLEDPLWKNVEEVRFIGNNQHAGLVAPLYLRKQLGQLGEIYLASPAVCHKASELKDPELALFRMRSTQLSPNLGGWHKADGYDFGIYSLAAELQKSRGIVTKSALALYRHHPAHTAFSFFRFIDEEACCYLAAIILDPRWYVDPDHPWRASRLESYLGLHPKTLAGVRREGETWGNHANCNVLLSAWQNPSVMNYLQRRAASVGSPTVAMAWQQYDTPPMDDPRDIQWRVWYKRNFNLYADLRASQRFLYLVRYVWLSELYANSHISDPLFNPDWYFRSSQELLAFDNHMKAAKKRRVSS